jgi:hypothetical protein
MQKFFLEAEQVGGLVVNREAYGHAALQTVAAKAFSDADVVMASAALLLVFQVVTIDGTP